MSVYDQLKSLNIELPPVAVPAAAYVPFVLKLGRQCRRFWVSYRLIG
jgi:hypothetical protein